MKTPCVQHLKDKKMLAMSITVRLHESLHRKVLISPSKIQSLRHYRKHKTIISRVLWITPFNQGLDQSHFLLDMIIESITLFNHDKTKSILVLLLTKWILLTQVNFNMDCNCKLKSSTQEYKSNYRFFPYRKRLKTLTLNNIFILKSSNYHSTSVLIMSCQTLVFILDF